ncbi:hypothetical protein SAMN05428949_0221 [Chitinophaga sp. YR627]|uniref:hypothetical protein n=1 Tax=Chitinophaga sp. YR627 TaxID=1881041 RepID=UPI0008EA214B|nr:hypothetical protein [Chitinophaga sp. YR627]SFM62647.1 hypothetical protein SAMN05428949_0221 [Chitinophaga sp. YR627]
MKPGFAISFWSFYTLGFTVVLPTFLYYVADSSDRQPQENAAMAFFYLGLGVVSWLILIGLVGRFFIRSVFTDKRRLEKSMDEGSPITAKIVRKMQTGVIGDGTPALELRLAFENLAGTPVEMLYELNDGRPLEKRFEAGNTIDMRVSVRGKEITLVPAQMQVVRNRGRVSVYAIIFFFFLLVAIVYPVFSYYQESQGSGWRFLTLSHPWISVPLINIGTGLFIWCLLSFIGKASGDSKDPLRMIMYGMKTTANILSYRQTGTYFNEQPQIQFEMEYSDHQHNNRHLVYKKIVSLLDVHKLSTGPREILFLPEAPEQIVFYEDLTL